MSDINLSEHYIDHEVRIRMQEQLYKQLNRKLDYIFATCAAIFTVVIIPILLHSLKLI